MISYFRTNDPYRIVGVILLVLLIRLPFYLSGIPILVPELKWLLIGDRLADGHLMYRDLWDVYGPLTVAVYKYIDLVFGQSRIAYFVISSLLVVFQSVVFNEMLLRNKAYNQSTYVPAFCYALCMNVFPDFMTLSPILMAMTFILLALNNLFARMSNLVQDQLFVSTGVYLAIATLFQFTTSIFLFIVVIALLLFAGSISRRVLLLFVSYFVVMLLASVYYFWQGSASYYHSFFIHSLWSVPISVWTGLLDTLLFSLIPILIVLFAFFRMIQIGKYINFQLRIQRVMLMCIGGGLFSLFLVKDFATYQLIWFVPSLAFFIAHLIQDMKSWLFAEITAASVALLLLFNCVFALKGWFFVDQSALYQYAAVNESEANVEGKKIWVIDERPDVYEGNKLGVGFLNWELSKETLTGAGVYESVIEINDQLQGDLPELILDRKQVMPLLFEKNPILGDYYDYQGSGIYILKPSS